MTRDIDQAVRFVAALAGDEATPMTWQTFDDSSKRRPHLARIMHGTLADVSRELERLNDEGAGVFVTVNQTDLKGRRKGNVIAVRSLFIDCDNGPPTAALEPRPSIAVESAGGPHYYWLAEGVALDDFRACQRRLAVHYGSDIAVNDLPRVMRVPGFLHCKAKPVLVRLLWAKQTTHAAGDVVPSKAHETPAPRTSATAYSGKGDLRTLDVVELFRSKQRYRRGLGDGKHAVRCPWSADHSREDSEADTSTVVWEASGGAWPSFLCLHGHCDGRRVEDVLAWAGDALVDAHCRDLYANAKQAELIARAQAWRDQYKAERAADEPETPIRTRRVIYRGTDGRDLRDQAIEVLAGHRGVYVASGVLARVGTGKRIEHMDRGAITSALVDVAEVRKRGRNGEAATEVPGQLLSMLESLDAAQSRRFRPLEVVTSSPFWSPAGRAVTDPGYCADARAVLVDPPPVTADLWTSPGAALAWLCGEVLEDFPWASTAERTNYLAALLVPLVRPMIDGPVPLINIEASRRGSGKSLLAQLICVIHGKPAEVGPLPRDESEVEKKIVAILITADPIHVWDNVKHAVNSPSLDVVTTSRWYNGRILGKSKTVRLPVRQLWVMTSNNAKLSEDMVRRMIRVRLVPAMEHPEDRVGFKHADILGWAKANRSLVLSALWQAVAAWIKAGKPTTTTAQGLGSFESFVAVVGGILAHAGVPDFLANRAESRTDSSMEADEWPAFLSAWWSASGPAAVTAKELLDLCDDELMLAARGSGQTLSQTMKLARAVRAQRDAIRYGYRVQVERDTHRKGLRYSLAKVH